MTCLISARLVITELIFALFCPFLADQKKRMMDRWTDGPMDRRTECHTLVWSIVYAKNISKGRAWHEIAYRQFFSHEASQCHRLEELPRLYRNTLFFYKHAVFTVQQKLKSVNRF